MGMVFSRIVKEIEVALELKIRKDTPWLFHSLLANHMLDVGTMRE